MSIPTTMAPPPVNDSSAPLVVDLFADIVCPWCFVGNERLERVLAARGPDGRPVMVRHHPFFLDPSTPPEGHNVPEMLRQRYGVDPKRVWARVEAEARKSGVELDLSKQPRSYPTARAHTLVRHAGARGVARPLVRELYRAYFLDAMNISDPTVLADIAARHGFDRDRATQLVLDEGEIALTRSNVDQAVRSGITGVPFFVFGDRFAVSGAQPEEVLEMAISRAEAS